MRATCSSRIHAMRRPGLCETSIRALVSKRGLRAFTYQLVGSGRRSKDAPLRAMQRRASGPPDVTRRNARAAWTMGIAGRGALEALRWHRCARGVLRRVGGQAARPRLRHRWCRHQGRCTRAATPARNDEQVPALGDRVQVPRRAEDHAPQADRGQRRPHRGGHAVRGARSGLRRRHDRLDGHAPQRRRHRAQGHPRARLGDRREGWRRHPSRRRSRAHQTAGRFCAVGDAVHVPAMRKRASSRGRGSGVALRERLVPRQASTRARALRVARRDEYRRARRVARRSSSSRAVSFATTPTSTTSPPINWRR